MYKFGFVQLNIYIVSRHHHQRHHYHHPSNVDIHHHRRRRRYHHRVNVLRWLHARCCLRHAYLPRQGTTIRLQMEVGRNV